MPMSPSAVRRYAKRRQALNTFKLALGCADCGYNKHPAALTFDHIKGEKTFNIGAGLLDHSWVAITKEIEKCEVVCANCHMIRTYGDK